MSGEIFTNSGENPNDIVVPTPILQGLFLPGMDNPQALDGFGIVTPWGGGSTTRKYADYGYSTEQNTQLRDLASAFLPAEGQGGQTLFNLEGLIGPQGIPGKDGTLLIIHEFVGTGGNPNFLTELPHNIDQINDLGTAADKLTYTASYDTFIINPSWTERRPAGDIDEYWESVASDSDGSNLIVGVNGGRLYTSDDFGVTWTERQPAGAANKNWLAVASDSDGSHLIAGDQNRRLYTSADSGVNWTERQPAGDFDKSWQSVASDDDGSHLIAGIGAGRLYTSANSGSSWTERQPAGDVNGNWLAAASDSDGSNLIVGECTGRLYTSANSGSSWTERQPAGAVDKCWDAVASDDDGSHLIVGAYGGRLYTSDDSGATWTERRPAGNVDKSWLSVASDSDGSHLIAAIEGGRLYISNDYGVSWTPERSANWYAVASDSDGSHLIAGASDEGRLYTGVATIYMEATWAEADLTSAGRDLLADATPADQATTLGLGTGDAVTHDTLTLTSIAAEGSDVDKFLVDSSGVIKFRTGAELLSDIGGVSADEKVGIDSGATADYVGATSSDGFLRTGAGITYTDGGDYITLVAAGSAFTSRCRVRLTSTQSVPSGSPTKLSLATEDWDGDNEFASNRFTATDAGYYAVEFGAQVSALGGNKQMYCAVYKNGVIWGLSNRDSSNPSFETKTVAGSDTVYLDATDYIEIFVFHNHGSNRDFSVLTYTNRASITRVQ